ncbi:MAG: hypothetical protein IPJ77_06010 [Planctomycetes bacterium]|nr:hypothetical protein [Planctomycetota bacterium]
MNWIRWFFSQPVSAYLLSAVAACTVGGRAPAQAPVRVTLNGTSVRIEGYRVREYSSSTASYEPLREMAVDAAYLPLPPSTASGLGLTQYADANGEVPIPAGYYPYYFNLAGPRSTRVYVREEHASTSQPTTFTTLNPVVHVNFLSGTPVLTNFPTQNAGIKVGHVSAYLNALEALDALEPWLGPTDQVITVAFRPYDTPTSASMQYSSATLHINCPEGPPWWGVAPDIDGVQAPRHLTVMAHEIAHYLTFLNWNSLGYPGWERFSEGLADFFGAYVAGTHLIGVGMPPQGSEPTLPRSVLNYVRYPPVWNQDPHLQGRILSGALWDTRLVLLAQGRLSGLPERRLRNVLALHPLDEPDYLLLLLEEDDDDGNLLNGTPHAYAYWVGFTRNHSIPWPTGVPIPNIARIQRLPPARQGHGPQ